MLYNEAMGYRSLSRFRNSGRAAREMHHVDMNTRCYECEFLRHEDEGPRRWLALEVFVAVTEDGTPSLRTLRFVTHADCLQLALI